MGVDLTCQQKWVQVLEIKEIELGDVSMKKRMQVLEIKNI